MTSVWRRIDIEITRSPSSSAMPRTPTDERLWNTRTSSTAKRMHWPPAAVSSTSSFSVQICTSTMAVALVELHRDDAGGANVDEIGQLVPPHGAARRREHHVELVPGRLVLGNRHDGGDGLALFERKNVDQRLAARLRRRQREPPDLFLVDLAARREEQHRRMGRGHEQPRDEILFAGLHAGAALAAARCCAIGRERHALDVTEMRHGDDHVLALDQVFVFDLAFLIDDHGAARRGEILLHRREFVLDDGLNAGARAQDVEIVGDLDGKLVELFLDFVAAKRGEALQAQIENGLGLFERQAIGAGFADAVTRIVDQREQGFDVARRPVARPSRLRAPRRRRARRGSAGSLRRYWRPRWRGRPAHGARSRALLSRNLVRRATTSSRNAMKVLSRSFSVITCGRPLSSATTLRRE